jgi:regulator of cell morphogenesis and NO signaling
MQEKYALEIHILFGYVFAMRNIAPETTIGEIVRALPATSRIFENLKIDYCCGGKKSLAEACRAKGLDAATVVAMLAALDQLANGAPADANAMSLSELCDHIQQMHHVYLHEELPRLDFMTRKVASVHGEHEPRLLELRQTFEIFNGEMTTHTREEDDFIFPAIRELEAGTNGDASSHAHLETTLTRLQREHDSAGAALEQFRSLTDNFTPPDWACNTFRALYDGLAHLEQNMHQHVHKENNVLFPKALAVAVAQPRKTRSKVHEVH